MGSTATAPWHARLGLALRPLALMGVGGVLPVVVCLLWFQAADAWSDLVWTFREFVPGYTKLDWHHDAPASFYSAVLYAFTRYSALAAVGAVAAAIGTPIAGREREGLALLLGVIAVHLAGIAMQAKFFPYHFGATLPLVALIAGLGWFKLWRKAVVNGGGGVVAFVSLLVVLALARVAVTDLPQSFFQRAERRVQYLFGRGKEPNREQLDRELSQVADYSLATDREMAHRVRELTSPEASLFVWGFEPLIYWLSDRRPASRFIYNVPQRTAWQSEHARALLLQDLARDVPQAIVVQHGDVMQMVTGNALDSNQALPGFSELESLLVREYRFVEKIDDLDLYLRRDASP